MHSSSPADSKLPASRRKITVLNSLDERYGSTYRLKALGDLLSGEFDVRFVQTASSPFHKLWLGLKEACSSYDLLFTQKFNPITFPAILIARLRRKPVVVDWDDWDTGLQTGGLRRWLTAATEKTGPRFATAITTHSKILEEKIRSLGRKAFYVPQGYSPDELSFDPGLRTQARTDFGFASEDFVVGHLCTLTHGGTLDLDGIFKAWSRIREPGIRFLLVGGGPLENRIRDRLRQLDLLSRVKITGLLDRRGVCRALHTLDLGVVLMNERPANQARISLKTLEYLALDIPVAGHVVGETRRLFGDLIRECDASGLSDAIVHISRHREHPKTSPAVFRYRWPEIAPNLKEAVRFALKGTESCL